ncbi:MAG TPA: carbohydrate ABC transporter permease [Bacillota bacterium]|nr:carbohydrate ABC transporter permease [Bacillota bacterium]HPA53846.1 carbohydrate ABC transporter permease [Bacillota bacterium]HPX69068.1 carbohydrate ABC transporter permease [Bacillota bacterium]HQA66056.1 carbohydrate ABC transporter permease [Bacillota bacterium]HQO42731.1 carbohydrate ABC transporter permease [Bacillota bacterium]
MRDFIKINRKADIALNIVMILCTIACVLPLLIVFSASITDEKTVTMYGYSLFPRNLSLEAYKYIYKDIMVILRAYGVTVFVTVVGSALSLVTIALYAYPISRKDFKYRNVFTFIVFLTMLFNGGLVPWYMVYVNVLHIDDTIMALILPYLMTPLYVLIMRTFFMTTIPDGIIEAARIDGAGEFQTFVWIVLPLAKPVLATIGLFNILTYWNDWYAPLLFINNEKLFNLQYLMYRVDKAIIYLSNNAGSINNATQIMANLPSQTARMAMAVVAIGPIILAYPFFQKYFVEGLTIGSIKG